MIAAAAISRAAASGRRQQQRRQTAAAAAAGAAQRRRPVRRQAICSRRHDAGPAGGRRLLPVESCHRESLQALKSHGLHEPVVVGLAGMEPEGPRIGLAGMGPMKYAEICNHM